MRWWYLTIVDVSKIGCHFRLWQILGAMSNITESSHETQGINDLSRQKATQCQPTKWSSEGWGSLRKGRYQFNGRRHWCLISNQVWVCFLLWVYWCISDCISISPCWPEDWRAIVFLAGFICIWPQQTPGLCDTSHNADGGVFSWSFWSFRTRRLTMLRKIAWIKAFPITIYFPKIFRLT